VPCVWLIQALISTIKTFHNSSECYTRLSLWGWWFWQVKPARASLDLAPASWVLAELAGFEGLGAPSGAAAATWEKCMDLEGARQKVLTRMIPFPARGSGSLGTSDPPTPTKQAYSPEPSPWQAAWMIHCRQRALHSLLLPLRSPVIPALEKMNGPEHILSFPLIFKEMLWCHWINGII